jgi:pilus assembly protein CpaB
MKEKIIPIVSVGVGVLAFALTMQYLRGKEDDLNRRWRELYAGAEQIKVVCAAHIIPRGTVITLDDIGKKNVFKSSVRQDVLLPEEVNMIIGKKSVFEISAKDPIFWSDIEGGAPSQGGLSSIVTPGLRAISLSVGGAAAVSGMVLPTDRVDVLGTFSFPSKTLSGEMETVTLTVLQDVTVLATGQDMANARYLRQRLSPNRSSGYNTVTLEVTAKEAELLVFTEHMKGSLTLSLRNPRDVHWKQDLPSVNFQHLQHALPELNLERQRDIRHKKIR